jgi:hypothetical protein
MAAKAELMVAAIVVNIQGSAKACEGGTPSFRHEWATLSIWVRRPVAWQIVL